MLITFTKSQGFLFDAPVHVKGHVRKDGTVVADHMRMQEVLAPQPAAAPRATKLDGFVAKHGGAKALGATLAALRPEHRHTLLAAMAKVGKTTVEAVAAMFGGHERPAAEVAPEPAPQGDLFAQPDADTGQQQVTSKEESGAVAGDSRGHEPADPAPANTPAKFAAGDIVEFKDRTGKMVAARVTAIEAWQNTLMAVTVSVPPRSPFKVGMTLRRTFDSVRLAHRPEVAAAEDAPLVAEPSARAPFGVPPGITKAARREINAKVVELVTDGRKDLDLMRQYSGNGGCGDSLNEFYTDEGVAASMWHVAARLAGPVGTAFEPSCATGVFLHTAPAGYRVTGVEMDPISQACAVALHGDRHEIMEPQSLERFSRSDGGRQFGVVIGNPPYGPRGSLAKDDKPRLASAETYFIDTAIDKCQPGGIIALVVPASVLNNKNGRAFRERMLRKAEFLGAQRMPNTAFEASHTDVTADIIWLRKRADDVAGALMTVDKDTLKAVGVWDPEFLSGDYFKWRGAANVFGKEGTAMRAFGEIYAVTGSMAGVAERLRDFEPHPVGTTPTVQDIVAALGSDEAAVKKALGGALVRPYAVGRDGDTKVVDGVTYVLRGRPLRWHNVADMLEHEAVSEARPLAQMIERATAGQDVDNDALAAAVQAYVARHGIPVKNKDLVAAADHDKVLHKLIGAVAPDGTLSDAVRGTRAAVVASSVETAAATLAAESETGGFTLGELSVRSGKPLKDLDDLVFASAGFAFDGIKGGQGFWTTMDAYLTGDLWTRLDAARHALTVKGIAEDPALAAKLQLQVKRLEETIAPKCLEDVEIMLNSAFLPTDLIESWMDSKVAELRAKDPKSQYYADMKPARVTFKDGIYTVTGGDGYHGTLVKYLNRDGVRQDDMPTINKWNEEFKKWILSSDRRDEIEDLYNRKFRGFVDREWSQAPIDVPGLDTDGGRRAPNAYHWDSLRWALHKGKGIIADDVGLGKTLRGLMLARLAKLNGKAQKPTFVVPKSVLANWVAEADLWFPGSRILVIGETYTRDKDGNLKSKPDTAAERNRKYHDLAQNDYDFVFINRDSFNELDLDPATKDHYMEQDFWVQRGKALGNAGDKRVRKVREQFEQGQAKREFDKKTDAVYFNDLPIDMLIMDEGHAYKNLYAAKQRFGESPKFLGGQGQSNRAFDLSFKTAWLRDKNQGKGIYMLTATPTKNSPLEIYSMLSYVAPEEFARCGIRNSEEFLERYCEFGRELISTTGQGVEEALVTKGFKNVNELTAIMAKYVKRRTAAEVGLVIPTAQEEKHLVDMTASQQAVYAGLRAELEAAKDGDAEGTAHIFSIMDRMAKAALDPGLLDLKTYAAAPISPKIAACATQAAAGAKEGGQVIFCEAVDAHEKIAEALVAAGVPRDRIGVMNGQVASSSAARQTLSDKFNAGKLDVIIGNKIMEEGVNLQKRTADIHHLDTPWDPATFQQRNGRGVRQGNKRGTVRVHPYLSRGSFDGYRYQSMAAKKDWQTELYSGADRIENLNKGKISRDDMMIAMAADPDAAREKILGDKQAAQERIAATGRVDAAQEFVRFQSMSRSLRGLKNKDTAAGQRLRVQIDRAKTKLAANRFFKAKGALDSNEDVLINPGTGDTVQRGMALECDEADGTKSRWVVTGVDSEAQTVSMRPYANTTGHGGTIVSVDKLANGVKEFEFNAAAEADEVTTKLTAAAEAKMAGIKSHPEAMAMPAAVLEKNYDLIQRQLKEHAQAYTGDFGHGDVPMVEKATGKVQSVDSYNHRTKHDSHDYFLPTMANRQAAVDSWMDERRRAKIASRHEEFGRRTKGRSNTVEKLGREYPGAKFTTKHLNPMRDLLNDIDGSKNTFGGRVDGPTIKAAKTRLDAEQIQRIHSAHSLRNAMDALMPLAAIGDKTVSYPPRALAAVWAKARRLGLLEASLMEHVEGKQIIAYGRKYPAHDSRAYGGQHERTVQDALLAMAAAGSKTRGLAVAMSRAAERHGVKASNQHSYQAMWKVANSGADPEVKLAAYRRMLAHAEAGGFADSTKAQAHQGWDGYSYHYSYSQEGKQSVRTYLKEEIDRTLNAIKTSKETT